MPTALGTPASGQHAGGAPALPEKLPSADSPHTPRAGGAELGGRSRTRVTVLAPQLSDGGVEQSQLNLADAFARRGHRVDLLFFDGVGRCPPAPTAAVRILDLRAERRWWRLAVWLLAHPTAGGLLAWVLLRAQRLTAPPYLLLRLLALTRYLRAERPAAIFAAGDRANLLAAYAGRIAGGRTRVVVSQHVRMSVHLAREVAAVGRWRARLALGVVRGAYLRAEAIVAVSTGTASDMVRTGRLPRHRVATVYNPVIAPDMAARAAPRPAHAWFAPGSPPVVLGAGRLVVQKDFATLIRAFAAVREQRPARLMILGEGGLRPQLETLANQLGVAGDVALPGFQRNPLRYMTHAAVFALSSTWEGLGNVLIEALACGCPVVSTDCPAGPAEILLGGQLGRLVPVGDSQALADAICDTLARPPPRPPLRRRGNWFTAGRAAERYLRCAGLPARAR